MKNLFTTVILVLSISVSAQTQAPRWKIEKKFNETIFNTMAFSDSTKGFAAGWEFDKDLGGFLNPSIKYTMDKGKSWKDATIDNFNMMPMRATKANGDTMVIAGIENNEDGIFSFSYDAGKSWKSQAMPEDLYSTYFLNGKEGFVCGKKGYLAYTKNSGLNWQTVSISTKDDIFSICFAKIGGTLFGYLCGENGLYATSSDTGKTWKLSSISSGFDLSSIVILKTGKGWMTSLDGVILETSDTGINWSAQFQNTSLKFNSISALNDTIAIAGGTKGELLVLKNKKWVSYLTLNSENDEITSEILNVSIIDKSNMWFCTGEGELVRTKREDDVSSKVSTIEKSNNKVFYQTISDNLVINNISGRPSHIYIINSLGSVVEDREIQAGENSIPCQNLAPGIYKVKFISKENIGSKVYTFVLNK